MRCIWHNGIDIFLLVTQWLECANDDRKIGMSHLQNFGNLVSLALPVSFGTDTKSCWALLSRVYAKGRKISHTGFKCITCWGPDVVEKEKVL